MYCKNRIRIPQLFRGVAGRGDPWKRVPIRLDSHSLSRIKECLFNDDIGTSRPSERECLFDTAQQAQESVYTKGLPPNVCDPATKAALVHSRAKSAAPSHYFPSTTSCFSLYGVRHDRTHTHWANQSQYPTPGEDSFFSLKIFFFLTTEPHLKTETSRINFQSLAKKPSM